MKLWTGSRKFWIISRKVRKTGGNKHHLEECLFNRIREIFITKIKPKKDEKQEKFHSPKIKNPKPTEGTKMYDSNYSVGLNTSLGKQRNQNQDAILAVSTTIKSGNLDQFVGLYAVADGMGGHKDGDLASQAAIQSFAKVTLPELTIPTEGSRSNKNTDWIEEILRAGTMAAHKYVSEEVPGGGTTLTAAVIIGKHAVITHTGDSRAYLINKNGKLQLLTRDHSVVNRMMELGKITKKQAADHPRRNVLYRALGQAEFNQPDISVHPTTNTKYLFLCSDGLWGVLNEDQISEIITASVTPQLACVNLVEESNKAGGPDNISTILIRFPDSKNE
jgi:protein phosphatase